VDVPVRQNCWLRRRMAVFCLLIFSLSGAPGIKTIRSHLDSERFFGNWIDMFRNIGVVLIGGLWIALGSLVYASEPTADQHTARAVQLVKEGKDKEALEEFTKAIEADSKNPMFYRNRAALYSRMKDWEHAAGDYSQVLSLQPDDLNSQLNRGIAYTEAKKFDEAQKDFAAVLAKKPDD
jgi:tetratricopeptide (TPR) repeat protein